MKKFMTIIAVVALVAFAAPAFAANPFADVPAGHWAYDAVAQLAADGLISGYPDGAFKGGRQATRYEVAAMVARAVARGDELHASKKDVELLKKLMVEFKDELDALGAKTDKLDKRVTKLEKGIGSWQISGRLKLDVNFTGGDNGANSQWTNGRGKYNITRDTARLMLRRQITEDTYFDSQFRIGSDWGSDQGMGDAKGALSVRKFYVGTKLPFWGLDLKVGRSQFDFEGDYGLTGDENPIVGDWRIDGFWFTKKWDTFKADFVFGRNTSGDGRFFNSASYDKKTAEYAADQVKNHYFTYGLNLKWTPNDKFAGGLIGYWMQGDGAEAAGVSVTTAAGKYAVNFGNVQTYGLTLGYKFTPNVALKGIYYLQRTTHSNIVNDFGQYIYGGKLDDNQHAWKVALDVKQDALKFTSLWVEYMSFTNGFRGGNLGGPGQVSTYTMDGAMSAEPSIMWVHPINNETSKVWFIKAEQKWNNKWSTFLRYNRGDWGTEGVDNAWDWGLGVKYKLNPAITFMLAYDQINVGDKTADQAGYVCGKTGLTGKDNVIFFQTDVKF